MVLPSALIVLLLLIALIHYIQGMFSATLSAILALLAAAVALGFQEPVLQMIKPAKLDIAGPGILCGLFIVSYLVMRIIFDRVVPGNVRLESTIDKVGAAIMGLIAGVICTGIIAIATSWMPFNSKLGVMYSRYAVEGDQEVSGAFSAQQSQAQVFTVFSPVKGAAFLPNDKDSSGMVDPNLNKMFVPVDDWTVGLVSAMSNGSLSGERKFTDIHPDYLQELYGERTGIQPAARHTAPNYPGASQAVEVESMYMMAAPPPPADIKKDHGVYVDAAASAVRKGDLDVQGVLPEKGKPLLIVRAKISASAGDDTSQSIDFSVAAVRLVVHYTDKNTSVESPTDIYPIGTYEDGKFYVDRMDDYLFAHGDSVVDFVFPLDDVQEVTTDAKPEAKAQTYTVRDGTLFQFKQLGLVDLSNKTVIAGTPPESKSAGVVRPDVVKPRPKAN
jgi:hypothetical protein